jgi:hypothetical protein
MQRPNRYPLWTGIFALGLGLCIVLASRGQGPALADKDLRQLVEHDAKAIQTILGKPKFEKKALGKVKAAAVMFAAYAQAAAAEQKNDALFALRDRALEVAKAAHEGKAEQARKLAAELSLDVKVPPGIKPNLVALEKHIDIATVMKQFAADRFGGFSLEKAIDDLVESKGPADDKAAAEIVRLAHKVATIASLARILPPESDQGNKTKAAWLGFTDKMQAVALDLAKVASTRKDAEVGPLADRLSQTCVKCHDIFREK